MFNLLVTQILRHICVHIFEYILKRILNSLFRLHELTINLLLVFFGNSFLFSIGPQFLIHKEELHTAEWILLIPLLLLIISAVFCRIIRCSMRTLAVCHCFNQYSLLLCTGIFMSIPEGCQNGENIISINLYSLDAISPGFYGKVHAGCL